MCSKKKPNMQPSGNLDLQPGANVKNVTGEEGRERGPAQVGALINYDRVGVVLGVVAVGGRRFLIVLILHSWTFP